MKLPMTATKKRSKEEAEELYNRVITQTDVSGRPWLKLDYQVPVSGIERSVEIPKFAGHVIRRAIRILFFNSDEGP